MMDLSRHHGFKQGDHARNIVVPEGEWSALSFADLDIGGEVHHGLDLVIRQGPGHGRSIAHIQLNQRPPLHSVAMSAGEVVKNDRFIAALGQRLVYTGARTVQ